MKAMKKTVAILLCLVMCLSMLPTWAAAEEAGVVADEQIEQLQEEMQHVENREEQPEQKAEPEEGKVPDEAVTFEETQETAPAGSEAVESEDNSLDILDVPDEAEEAAETEICGTESDEQPAAEAEECDQAKQIATKTLPETAIASETESSTTKESEDVEGQAYVSLQSAEIQSEPEEKADLMAASGNWGNNLQWELDNNGVLFIRGSGEMMADDRAAEMGSGYPWYPYRESVKRITISQGITSIAYAAFAFSNAVTADLPEGLITISDDAFFRNYKLSNLKLPSTLVTLGSEAFVGTLIPSFHIPASLTTIYGTALLTWANDTKVSVDPNNPVFHTDRDGVLYEGDWRLIWCPMSLSGNYTVKGTVEIIESYAFSKSKNLTSVVFPESVRQIGSFVFTSNQKMKNVWFMGSKPEIWNDPFYNVTATVYYHDDGTWTEADMQNYGGSLTWIPIDSRVKFIDVADEKQYYFDPVYWAVDRGITTGRSDTSFDPYGQCTRGHIVTFLWRAFGEQEPTVNNPFEDVHEGDSFYKAVLWAYENGITTGQTATTFGPWKSCTRGQIVTFLWRAMGQAEPGIGNPFTDVNPGDGFYRAVLWAVENSITTGRTPTTFDPWATCTRGQAVTFLYRAMN